MACRRFVASILISFLVSQASVGEDYFHKRNEEAAAYHDVAMHELVDELSVCAGLFSLIEPAAGTGTKITEAVKQHAVFLALGADALINISPGPRSDRLLEMEARLLVSRRELLNTFGSMGGFVNADTSQMETECKELRGSKRRVFGWSVP